MEFDKFSNGLQPMLFGLTKKKFLPPVFQLFFCCMTDPRQLRILFLGTPEFAAASLKKLMLEGANVVAVVTAPDKPAGRGLGIQKSAVKEIAETFSLPVLQPIKLKDPDFLTQLQAYDFDLGIVVAFRMLPELVWQMPRLGTINLHGSLLPKYRGAAPIYWAIINGETETGITTFFLKHEIDTGDLLLQERIPILPEDNVGSLYQKMMEQGANLVWKTVEGICQKTLVPFPQSEELSVAAPKIFKETCQLNFGKTAVQIHNQIRGLSPIPGAFTHLEGKVLKIFKGKVSERPVNNFTPGTFRQIEAGILAVSCSDNWYELEEIQPEGKRKMLAKEFLAGHKIEKL
jgi:methionyl-tRNA formyltransferase